MEHDVSPAPPGPPGLETDGGVDWRRIGFRLAAVLVALVVAGVAFELGLRAFCRSLDRDERTLLYRYDEQLGWFPKANSRGTFTGSRTISISHNSDGFRGPEYVATAKPTLVVLGDSFVWGFDVNADERFTEKLQARHPEGAVYNLGVSGYGTDQEYLLLQRWFRKYRPRVVLLVYCTDNDDSDNCSNYRFGYYKPYCTVTGTRLELKGIPVPRGVRIFWAEHPVLCRSYVARLLAAAWCALKGPPALHNPNPTGPILRDLQKYVHSQGAILVVGLTHGWGPLKEFFQAFQIPCVDLSTDLVYPSNGSHWTPQGQSWVAEKLDAFLTQGKFMDAEPFPNLRIPVAPASGNE